MKGLKFLVSCAAVGALSAACAVSSLAADTTYKATVSSYDKTTGKATITVDAAYDALVGGDYTLLVLSEDATSITNDNTSIVKQIQQGEKTILTDVMVGKDLTEFYVRVGGAEATTTNATGYAAGHYVEQSDSPYDNPDRLLGDVDDSEDIAPEDASAIMSYLVDSDDSVIVDTDSASAADVDESGDVSPEDAVAIMSYLVDSDDSYVDETKTIGDRAEACESY